MLRVKIIAALFLCLFVFFFPFIVGFYFSGLKSKPTSNIPTPQPTPTITTKKTDQPELIFFTMSFCPNSQLETNLSTVFDLFQNKIKIFPHYLFKEVTDSSILDEKQYLRSSNGKLYTSLRGRQEVTQNVRELCAWKLTPDKQAWWQFVTLVHQNCNSQNADTCWEEQGKIASLDTNQITDCFNKEAFNLIEQEITFANQHQVFSSPTLLINNILVPSDSISTPEKIKKYICASMKNPSKECNQIIPDPTDQSTLLNNCQN